MPFPLRSSRLRYSKYREQLKERRKSPEAKAEDAAVSFTHTGPPRKHKKRSRSFRRLFVQFWGLLEGQHRTLFLALIGLTISTILGLLPLYGTKIVFDGVLRPIPVQSTAPTPTNGAAPSSGVSQAHSTVQPPPPPANVEAPHRPLLPHALARFIRLPDDPRILLTVVAIGMVLLAIASEAAGLSSRWQTTRMTKRVQVAVRKRVFDHAVRLPLHRVYDLKSGGVASILREDAGGVAELIFSMLYNPSRAIVQLIGSLIILAFVDWRLLLGSLLLLPTVWLTHRTWISRIRPVFRDIRNTRTQIDSHATEAFGGMRVVRSFSRQQAEAATFTRNGHLMARQEIFAWWWMRGIDLSWSILIPLASAILLYFGGMRVLSDMDKLSRHLIEPSQALTVGDLVMFLAYLGYLLGPIATLAASATALQNSLSGLDRVLDLLDEPLEMPAKPGAITVTRETAQGRITFRDVSFTYTGGSEPVLQDVTLDVHPGEMIALVGPSGAGKTTLCNLVARFYDPTAGAVMLDGANLTDITAESYRRLLGIVEQDTFLFDGTIRENIAYGRRGASMEEIIHAAKLANADEFVSKLPEGYDSIIGERGVKLSGGQRQRLTIARAILADPRILILDEATSNLDTESERLIQASLQTLMGGRTSFVIAHRLSTIAHADRILVLENGRIVEQGRHEELMQASGRYRTMVDLQTSPPVAPKGALRNSKAEELTEVES